MRHPIPYPFEEVFTSDHHESAIVHLAILKENFRYREFFKKLSEDPVAVCPILRKDDEDDNAYQKRIVVQQAQGDSLFGDFVDVFGLNGWFFIEAQQNSHIPSSEILTLLDPGKDHSASAGPLVRILPLMFSSPALEEVGRATGIEYVPGSGYQYKRYKCATVIKLQPYERLLKIDLSKKRSQIRHELDLFIEQEMETMKARRRFFPDLRDWEPERNRERKEIIDQLKVWKARMNRPKKTFLQIASDLGTNEDHVKKMFYVIWQKTQGVAYDAEQYYEIVKSTQILKQDLLKRCDTCEDQSCLASLKNGLEWRPCPEAAAYIEQDKVYRREGYLEEIKVIGGRDFKKDADNYTDELLAFIEGNDPM